MQHEMLKAFNHKFITEFKMKLLTFFRREKNEKLLTKKIKCKNCLPYEISSLQNITRAKTHCLQQLVKVNDYSAIKGMPDATKYKKHSIFLLIFYLPIACKGH